MIVKTTTMKDRIVSLKMTDLTKFEEIDLLVLIRSLVVAQRSNVTPLEIYRAGYRWSKTTYGCAGEVAICDLQPLSLHLGVLDFCAVLSALHMVESHQLGLIKSDVWLRKGPPNSEISITFGLYKVRENPVISLSVELPPRALKACLEGNL
jgi:hypothetical protein